MLVDTGTEKVSIKLFTFFLLKDLFANYFSNLNICCMISKAATRQKILNVGDNLLVINEVKGDPFLYRVMVNSEFCGYIQWRENEFHRVDGSKINNLIFTRICEVMK